MACHLARSNGIPFSTFQWHPKWNVPVKIWIWQRTKWHVPMPSLKSVIPASLVKTHNIIHITGCSLEKFLLQLFQLPKPSIELTINKLCLIPQIRFIIHKSRLRNILYSTAELFRAAFLALALIDPHNHGNVNYYIITASTILSVDFLTFCENTHANPDLRVSTGCY